MKRHLNLMSNSARVRSITRNCIRQWSLVYACVVFLLTPLLIFAWWPVHQEDQNVASLAARYEPTRQLRRTSRSFKEQIEQIRAKEHAALALAKIDTPVVSLLGLVGKTVAESQGSIVLEKINFSQDTNLRSTPTADTNPTLRLRGIAQNDQAIAQLTSSLQSVFPFGKIVLQSSEPAELYQQKIYRFNIECSL